MRFYFFIFILATAACTSPTSNQDPAVSVPETVQSVHAPDSSTSVLENAKDFICHQMDGVVYAQKSLLRFECHADTFCEGSVGCVDGFVNYTTITEDEKVVINDTVLEVQQYKLISLVDFDLTQDCVGTVAPIGWIGSFDDGRVTYRGQPYYDRFYVSVVSFIDGVCQMAPVPFPCEEGTHPENIGDFPVQARCVADVQCIQNEDCEVPQTDCLINECVEGVCVESDRDGEVCNDDNNLCTTGICNDDVCEEDVVVCEGTFCKQEVCNPNNGACEESDRQDDGTQCDDALFCTVEDACQDGICVGNQRDCDDDNECTTDLACDEVLDLCVHNNVANDSDCEDGNGCTEGDTCQDGACVSGEIQDCSVDAEICTTGSCVDNDGAGQCVFDPVENGNLCFEDDPSQKCVEQECLDNILVCDTTDPQLQQSDNISCVTFDQTHYVTHCEPAPGETVGRRVTVKACVNACAGTDCVTNEPFPCQQDADCAELEVCGANDVCVPRDRDDDGVSDIDDNCREFANPAADNGTQNDFDNDGFGDICDNCPQDPNADQRDTDGNGQGDVCDPNCNENCDPDAIEVDCNDGADNDGDNLIDCADGDCANHADCLDSDNDGILDVNDNCPNVLNQGQDNSDADTYGDACDNCPNDDNQDQSDVDGDSVGDVCDVETCDDVGGLDEDGDGDSNCDDPDCDLDPVCANQAGNIYYSDIVEQVFEVSCAQCHMGNAVSGGLSLAGGYDTLVGVTSQSQFGQGMEFIQPFSTENSLLYRRVTGDGFSRMPPDIGNNQALSQDQLNLLENWILAGAPNDPPVDPCVDNGGDTDGDGVCDDVDNCVDNPNIPQTDTDLDGVGDVCDNCPSDNPDDTDMDTVCDSDDVCPGFDDLADADNDGTADGCDICPNDNTDQCNAQQCVPREGGEVCNGLDDDCDGDVDNGLGTPEQRAAQGVVCPVATNTCVEDANCQAQELCANGFCFSVTINFRGDLSAGEQAELSSGSDSAGSDFYDDDGDCFCEVRPGDAHYNAANPCPLGTAAADGVCGQLLGGDCNDHDDTNGPHTQDWPGDNYDNNCDGVVD
ncbi:MAG: hypothetical protein CL685_03775 [Candidatus Magasanikbacteria bacterium]|nr:hypothetical protein [Candidatus Magasanikbacteria bacterium]